MFTVLLFDEASCCLSLHRLYEQVTAEGNEQDNGPEYANNCANSYPCRIKISDYWEFDEFEAEYHCTRKKENPALSSL